MGFRDALADIRRHGGDARLFPGERRTTTGRFTGTGGRLVHVSPGGGLRDFGYPLSGLTGLERSRFGLLPAADAEAVTWLDEVDGQQRYVGETTLVETTHATPAGSLRQYDVTVGAAHLTRFEAGGVDGTPTVVVEAGFAPDGREERVGQLQFDGAAEVYHADEHDFVASSTGFDDLRCQPPAPLAELLEEASAPRTSPAAAQYEESRLSGTVAARLPVPEGGATLGSLLTDATETDREAALERLEASLERTGDVAAMKSAAERGLPSAPASAPGTVAADLRVLSLLSAETGLRMAGPDFDPHYCHSGGYGYTWFRDDAEISGFLLSAHERFDLGLESSLRRSARMYCRTQRPDGSWPHRVWPSDGSLAPGWANGRIEGRGDGEYQADQTASVVAFLADLRRRGLAPDGTDAALRGGLESLDSSLGDDGLPVACQNAWEDSVGRFSHTAATFLEAYAAVAATDHPGADRARERATTVFEGLSGLWVPERDAYAMRETVDGDVDDRYDSASLALVAAHAAYDRVGTVGDDRLDRLVAHLESVTDGLARDPRESDVAGLARYEGDGWRRKDQSAPKPWTLSTGLGAHAAVELALLLEARDDPRAERTARRGRRLFERIAPGGPLCEPTGYLPEQYFDDGTPDSATPLGWSHAIRLATAALLEASDHLEASAADGG